MFSLRFAARRSRSNWARLAVSSDIVHVVFMETSVGENHGGLSSTTLGVDGTVKRAAL